MTLKKPTWTKLRTKLKQVYEAKGITTCELHFPGCTNNCFLGFAHKHKRIWYKGNPEKLGAFEETVLACTNCHELMEYNRELTEKVFKLLRS